MTCHIICDRPAPEVELYYSCCGSPADGSSCDHRGEAEGEEPGQPTCGPYGAAEGWWAADE